MSDAAMAAAAPPVVKKGINLALQGGGAHGAFTWGVLDYLLEGWTPDDRRHFRRLGRRTECGDGRRRPRARRP
jgi:hypothetical protein